MTAIIAAVLFGLALIFQLANFSLSVISSTVLVTAGLLCVALHLAGVGNTVQRAQLPPPAVSRAVPIPVRHLPAAGRMDGARAG